MQLELFSPGEMFGSKKPLTFLSYIAYRMSRLTMDTLSVLINISQERLVRQLADLHRSKIVNKLMEEYNAIYGIGVENIVNE